MYTVVVVVEVIDTVGITGSGGGSVGDSRARKI